MKKCLDKRCYSLHVILSLIWGAIWYILSIQVKSERMIVLIILGIFLVLAFTMSLCSKELMLRQCLHLDSYSYVMYIFLFAFSQYSPIKEAPNKMCFAIITYACLVFTRKMKNAQSCALSKNLKHSIIRCFFALVIAFQFIGYQIFYTDSKFYINIANIICFILFILWAYRLLRASEYVFMKLSAKIVPCDAEENKLQLRKVKMFIFAILFLGGMVIFILYFPGIYSGDVVGCYQEAKHIADSTIRSDIHSFLYVLLLSMFARFSDSCYLITLCFLTIYCSVISSFLIYFYKLGVQLKYILTISFLLVIFPNNVFMSVALWKDVPFSIALIALTYAWVKIIIEGPEFARSKLNILQLSLSIICTALFRSNGIVVIFLTMVMAVYLCKKKKIDIRCLTAIIANVAIVFIIKVPLYNMLDVKGSDEWLACIPFIDGVWTNVYVGNTLSEGTIEYLNNIMPIEEWRNNYITSYCNSYVFANNLDAVKLDASIKSWLECIRKYPADTIGARLYKTDMIWSVFRNEGADMRFNVDFALAQIREAEEFGWYWLESTYVGRLYFSVYVRYFCKYLSVLFRGGG